MLPEYVATGFRGTREAYHESVTEMFFGEEANESINLFTRQTESLAVTRASDDGSQPPVCIGMQNFTVHIIQISKYVYKDKR